MRSAHPFIPVVVAALAVPAGLHRPAWAGDPPAMRAHVDPATGALVSEPRAPEPPSPADPARSRSAQGLVEEPAPGGGVMVHLQGRFHTPVVAGVDEGGRVSVHHAADPASR